MTLQVTIFSIEPVPGDEPRGMEQPNGDLLVPANARPLIEDALLKAEQALATRQPIDLAVLRDAMRLLNIERPAPKCGWLGNLYRVRAL